MGFYYWGFISGGFLEPETWRCISKITTQLVRNIVHKWNIKVIAMETDYCWEFTLPLKTNLSVFPQELSSWIICRLFVCVGVVALWLKGLFIEFLHPINHEHWKNNSQKCISVFYSEDWRSSDQGNSESNRQEAKIYAVFHTCCMHSVYIVS